MHFNKIIQSASYITLILFVLRSPGMASLAHRNNKGAKDFEIKAGKKDTVNKNKSNATLFVPGEIAPKAPINASPAFTPDNLLFFFTQSQGGNHLTIMVSQRSEGVWSEPKIAFFSGKFRDLEPAFSPDGKYLIFASNRPEKPGDSVLTGHYNGQVLPGSGGNLWKVDFSEKGTPRITRLPGVINANSSVFSPCVVADGSLYFMRADSGAKFHIYRSAFKNGIYQAPVKTSFSLDRFGDYDPAVAPDESFLIFSSARPPAPKTADLFIVFRASEGWSEPADLRSILGDDVYGVEARLAPDLSKLYYSNSRRASGETMSTEQYIWKVNITALLKARGITK